MGTNEGLSMRVIRKILFVLIVLIFMFAIISFASKNELH